MFNATRHPKERIKVVSKPASIKKRFLAFFLDRLVILAGGTFPLWCVELLVAFSSEITVNPFFPPFLLPFFISFYLFYVLFVEGLCSGRTVGKKILGLRVVGEDGKPWGLRQSFTRNALRIVDAFPAGFYLLGLGFIWRKRARFGDLVAKTKVIEEKRKLAIGWPRPTPGWLRPAAGFCLVCLVPNFLLQAALWEGGETMKIPKMKGIVVYSWPENAQQRALMLDRIENAGFNAIRFSWEVSFPSSEFMAEIQERGFSVLMGTGGGWTSRKSTEDVAQMVDEYDEFENIYWGIGNEDYATDLTIPRKYLKEINEAFKERSEKPTFFASQLVLHAPDFLILRQMGYGPIEFVDVLGYNAYPPAQAASWTDLIEMWRQNVRKGTNPIFRAVIDFGIDSFMPLEKTLVEPVKKNTFGYGYLVYSYLAHAKLVHKPLVITEWGADRDPDFARGQWGVLRKFPEIRGIFFFDWGCIDWNRDGEIDGKDLYDYLSEIEF